jgi:hypothetical protein
MADAKGGCPRVCWRAREAQTTHRGPPKGQKIQTDKRPLRHLARLILIGLFTGTCASAIATASAPRREGHSFVDLEEGIFYRLAIGRRATKKHQPTVPIPPRLPAHLRRWKAKGIAREHFVREVQAKTASETAGPSSPAGSRRTGGRRRVSGHEPSKR